MIIKRKTLSGLVLLSVLLIHIACSDPLSEEDKKAVVSTLVQGSLNAGEYAVFWDGTDDAGKFLTPGTYYARFSSRDFVFQIDMTALEGGTVSNDSSYFIPGNPPLNSLGQNHPDPFRIKSGTNIPFTLRESIAVELTIRNKE